MGVRITFACGHSAVVHSGGAAPLCAMDGERRIVTVSAPPPRFRGIATGPYAEFVALPAEPVSLTEKASE